MRALMLESGSLSLRDVPAPPPGEGEVVLEVGLTGICGTDLELMRGYAPFTGTPGHEFVGRVLHPGSSEFPSGTRVVCEINVACGRCEYCVRGLPTHCSVRQVIGIRGRAGAFAELVRVPSRNLHKVPDVVDDRQAAFVEPLAAALQVPDQVEVAPGMRVLVVGAGRLGQLVARVLALHAVDLQVVTRHARHRELLEQVDVSGVSEGEVDDASADMVVDTSGHPSGLALALRALRPRGTLVVKSTFAGQLALDPARLVVDELTVVGSRCGPFQQAVEAIATGQVDPSPLVDAVFPLDRYEEAFSAAQRPGALKVLLDPRRKAAGGEA